MSKTVSVHYQSPPNDPHKLPRPHHLKRLTFGDPVDIGGGELPGRLVGFVKTLDFDGTDVDQFVLADGLYGDATGVGALSVTELSDRYRGWYPVTALDGQWSTYDMPIERISIFDPETANADV